MFQSYGWTPCQFPQIALYDQRRVKVALAQVQVTQFQGITERKGIMRVTEYRSELFKIRSDPSSASFGYFAYRGRWVFYVS